MTRVEAIYFDGNSARGHRVVLDMQDGRLRVHGETIQREAAADEYSVSDRLGNTPRLIQFNDGARCEIADQAGLESLLQEAGIATSWVGHLESRWRYALSALLVTLAVVAIAYLWGLPYAAEKAAFRVPERWLAFIDEQFLSTFDDRLLEPSRLGPERQQVISSRLRKLRLPPGATRPAVVLFRSSPAIGPNAFALPGGTVVILDEIVHLSGNDEEILAVLAHEMGHVAERHALRQMLQASIVGLAMAWYVGDISNVLAAAPATLLETRYSRDFERRADAFGGKLLERNGIPAARLADILEKLENARDEPATGKSDAMDYLSTHPNTGERIRTLRGQR